MNKDKTAPVQDGPRIPWALHVEAWKRYVSKYGTGQSAERIAERGGFGCGEMDEFVPDWRARIGAGVKPHD